SRGRQRANQSGAGRPEREPTMTRSTHTLLGAFLAGAMVVAAQAQTPRPKTETKKVAPRFEAVAETKLLMEGLAESNYRGLATLPKQSPTDSETGTFARGQALLIAETGNLLLWRPPRNEGQDSWFRWATELRAAATNLARQAGARDYAASRAALLT